MEPDVDQRLRDIERSVLELSQVPARSIEFLNVEPDKKRDGMLVGADGTDWNPGDGQGIYAYFNAVWNKLLHSVTSLLGLNNTWTGTNTHTKRVNHAVHTEIAHATTSDPWTGGNLCLYSGSAVTFADIADAPVVGAVVIAIMNATHTWVDGAVFEVDGNANYVCRVGDVVRIEAKTVSTFRINILSTGDGLPVVLAPAFAAYVGTEQGITANTFTKVIFDTEEYDLTSAFDKDTNYRFTPLVEGYYQVSWRVSNIASTTATRCLTSLYKNGVSNKRGEDILTATGFGSTGSALIFLNGSTDYIEVFTYISAATAKYDDGSSLSFFQAVLVRGA